MYAGFALQLLAFACLWLLLRRTIQRRRLASALAVVTALLMFCLHNETWLWGFASLQWHLCNLTAAMAIGLLARGPGRKHVLVLCFLLTCIGTFALASGMALSGVVFVALIGERRAERIDWKPLVWWAAAAVALAAAFFAGWHTDRGADMLFFVTHPLQSVDFVLIDLGSALVPSGASSSRRFWDCRAWRARWQSPSPSAGPQMQAAPFPSCGCQSTRFWWRSSRRSDASALPRSGGDEQVRIDGHPVLGRGRRGQRTDV